MAQMYLMIGGNNMNVYSILLVDDEYYDRKNTYLSFFEKEFCKSDYSYKVIPIQTVAEFNNFCSEKKHVDAIFLDAKLDGSWRDNYTCFGVLQKIEEMFTKRQTPPVFMVSKNWRENEDLLMNVSMNLSSLKKFEHPSAFYDFCNLESIVGDAVKIEMYRDEDSDRASLFLQALLYHREFIKNEIEKHQAMEKADAVIISAVTDEKAMIYRVFELDDKNDKTSEMGFVYQNSVIHGFRITFVTQTRMGLSDAARIAECAIESFEPSVVIMGGICAGAKEKIGLGSIVIPRQIYDYSSGKITTEGGEPKFLSRLESVPESSRMTQYYQQVENENNSKSDISSIYQSFYGLSQRDVPQMRIVTYPMASGPWVLDSDRVFNAIKNIIPHDKFCSIDMEAYAFASVANSHNLPWIVIKTVQDYANGEKSSDEEIARGYSTFSSAKLISMHLKDIINIAKANT